MDRRNFLKASCTLCGLGIAGTAIFMESCKKSSTTPTTAANVNFMLDLTQAANAPLNTSGGSVASNNVIVVNIGGSYLALSEICTHQGCDVSYNQNRNDFICPCHGSTFNINGNVTNGPAASPLKNYTVTKNGNILTITG